MTDTTVPRQIPVNPSLERLRKEAKQHLKTMRLADGETSLANAQFRLARSYGFSSWRALKEEVERRRGAAAQSSSHMGAFLTRRITASHWMLDAEKAEGVFSPLSAFSLLVLQPLAPLAFHLLH